MKCGVLLISTGIPSDSSVEALRVYTDAVFGSELYAEGLGLVQGQMFKKVTVPAKAREWARYFESAGNSTIENYRKVLESLRSKLTAQLAQTSRKQIVVAAAMRCGEPAVESAVAQLKAEKCDVVLVLPLCPFYFKPLVDPALKAARDAIAQARDAKWNPTIKEVLSFCKTPSYVKALAGRIEHDWQPRNVSRLLILMPSQPRALSESDCTYEDQISELKSQLHKRLKIGYEHIHVSYLCEFDNAKWVGPFAEKTLLGWAGGAVRDVRAVSPAFCLPDPMGAYDAGLRLGDYFRKNVIGKPSVYGFVSSFDDDDAFVGVLGDVVKKSL